MVTYVTNNYKILQISKFLRKIHPLSNIGYFANIAIITGSLSLPKEVSCVVLLNMEQDQILLWTCVASANPQYMNNHYAKLNCKGESSLTIFQSDDYSQ